MPSIRRKISGYFFEADVTEEQLKKAGEAFRRSRVFPKWNMCRESRRGRISRQNILRIDPELAQEFDENPLKDSFNYKLTVELSANTKEVREAIENVEAVRDGF